MADPQADADARLMRAFQAGDRAAFETLFQRHTPPLSVINEAGPRAAHPILREKPPRT